MSGPDSTTDKMFPPPESNVPPERPIPLQPSIREAFYAHHQAMLAQWGQFRQELLGIMDAKLEAAKPSETAASIRAKVTNGALAGLRYGGVALALGQAAAEIARATGHPELAGPIDLILKGFGVVQ